MLVCLDKNLTNREGIQNIIALEIVIVVPVWVASDTWGIDAPMISDKM